MHVATVRNMFGFPIACGIYTDRTPRTRLGSSAVSLDARSQTFVRPAPKYSLSNEQLSTQFYPSRQVGLKTTIDQLLNSKLSAPLRIASGVTRGRRPGNL